MPAAAPPAETALAPGAYLTDGVRLLRVVRPLEHVPGSSTAQLEDCLTLEVRTYGAEELWRLGLRPVRPAGEDA